MPQGPIAITQSPAEGGTNSALYINALANALKAELVLLHVVDSRFDTFPYLEAVERPSRDHLHKRAEKLLRLILTKFLVI